MKIRKKVVEYYFFYCPGCKHEHVYSVMTDGWQFNNNIENPSFTPSLLNTQKILNETTGVYEEKSRCHLYVTDGKIVYCGDCTHEFNGQTIELSELK